MKFKNKILLIGYSNLAKRRLIKTFIKKKILFSVASKSFKKNFHKLSPIGRTCDKKELRGPFIFLSSDASSYMNGSLFVIDGGWTAW